MYESDSDEHNEKCLTKYGEIVEVNITDYYKYGMVANVLTSNGSYLRLHFYTDMWGFDSTDIYWSQLKDVDITEYDTLEFYKPQKCCPDLQKKLTNYIESTPQHKLEAEYLLENIGTLLSCKILSIKNTIFELEGKVKTQDGDIKFINFLTGDDIDMIYRYEPTYEYNSTYMTAKRYWDDVAIPYCMLV